MNTITFRRSNDHDRRALERLATLDSSRTLRGDALIAEQDGAMLAAVTLDGRSSIADPFKPTAAIVAMLRSWRLQFA
jgi:hypothetical protein